MHCVRSIPSKTLFLSTAKLAAMSEAERRQEIEKEKSARQAAQANQLEKERKGNEEAAISAVSIGTQQQMCY
jgi:hypothetical protein